MSCVNTSQDKMSRNDRGRGWRSRSAERVMRWVICPKRARPLGHDDFAALSLKMSRRRAWRRARRKNYLPPRSRAVVFRYLAGGRRSRSTDRRDRSRDDRIDDDRGHDDRGDHRRAAATARVMMAPSAPPAPAAAGYGVDFRRGKFSYAFIRFHIRSFLQYSGFAPRVGGGIRRRG